jgi:DNA polymerase elongation subunit (family B)
MSTSAELTTSTQWIHSCRVRSDDRDFIAVKTKVVTIDQDNKIVNSEDKMKFINNPQRKIWITKKAFQNHTDKKESEDIKKTDEYIIRDKELIFELKKAMGLTYLKSYTSLKKLCDSPYIYGADVGMEALVRLKYKTQAKHQMFQLSTGAYDHEQSVLGCKRINAITVVLGKDVYTAALKDFTKNNIDENGNYHTHDKTQMVSYAYEVLKPYIAEHGFTLNMEVFETEVEMFKYIFAAIHKHKTDFVGIWNIDYDIPSFIDRCHANGANFDDIAHHPDIPQKYKFSYYKEDKRKTQHNTDKWPWLHQVGYTQFIDAMLAYARIRKNQTKEPSYSLDAISTKIIGQGKLKFGDHVDHYEMQSKYFTRYVAYNIADAILIQLMFWKTHDPEALVELTGISALSDFSKQATMLKDQLYAYYLSLGRVLGSAGSNNHEPHTQYLEKIGGTVLSPYLIKKVGLHAVKDYPEIETYAYAHNYDADYASIYPNAKISFNISKDTKLSTVIQINGTRSVPKIEKLCGGLSTPMENAVSICSDFFGLPTYLEMEQLFQEHIAKEEKV